MYHAESNSDTVSAMNISEQDSHIESETILE